MTQRQRELKVNALKNFIGDKVRVHLRQMSIQDIDKDGDFITSSTIEGFLLDIDTAAVYMGGDPDAGYTHVIDLEVVGMMNLVDEELDDIIELLQGEIPIDDEMH